MTTEEQIQSFRRSYAALRDEIGKVIVGNDEIVEGTLIAIFAGGHVLLEGVPGLGKTLLVRTLSDVLDLSFNRIQFTPDLMPADILGTKLVGRNPGRRRNPQTRRTVLRAGDAKSHRPGRDVSVARSAARPFLFQTAGGLSQRR